MKLLTRWGRDMMATICISFPNTVSQKNKKITAICSVNAICAVNYKLKLVQAMAWHREDSKPLPESVVIQANGAYMSLLDWLITSPYSENISMQRKRGIVWANEGYLHPHSWKWAILTPQVGSGRGTGWPYFVKSPIARSVCERAFSLLGFRFQIPWLILHSAEELVFFRFENCLPVPEHRN